MANDKVTLKLFHGRNSPDEQPEDWGFDGPSLGPLEAVQLTYGWAAVFAAVDDRIELPRVRGLYVYDGKFYGDVSIFAASVQPPTEQIVENATRIPGLPHFSEHDPVVLPPNVRNEYRVRAAIFVDSIRELAGDRTAESLRRALEVVVPDRLNTPLIRP